MIILGTWSFLLKYYCSHDHIQKQSSLGKHLILGINLSESITSCYTKEKERNYYYNHFTVTPPMKREKPMNFKKYINYTDQNTSNNLNPQIQIIMTQRLMDKLI